MKKIRLLCASLSALLLLTACQTAPAPAPQTEPSVTEAPTAPAIEPDVTPVYENMYAVSLPVITENIDSDGEQELIYSYFYQSMVADFPDRDVARKITMDFTDRIEKSRTVSNDFRTKAEADYHSGGSFTPYSYELQYNITRIDQGVLSLFGHAVQIGDTPRANSKLISVNYDTVTGDVLTVGSILYLAEKKDDLEQLVISSLENLTEIRLFDDFREIVSARFDRDESLDEDFYFSANGLCFYFAPEEIAPRSYSTIVAEIPYNELTQIIVDACFPAERSYTKGTMAIHKFSDADLTSYQQFTEVIANEDGTKMLLTTDSAVQDIRIYELMWTSDGLAYTQTKNIYAANFLSSDNAIVLESQFNSFRPSYLVSYAVDGVTNTFYTVANSATGEVTLETTYTP